MSKVKSKAAHPPLHHSTAPSASSFSKMHKNFQYHWVTCSSASLMSSTEGDGAGRRASADVPILTTNYGIQLIKLHNKQKPRTVCVWYVCAKRKSNKWAWAKKKTRGEFAVIKTFSWSTSTQDKSPFADAKWKVEATLWLPTLGGLSVPRGHKKSALV